MKELFKKNKIFIIMILIFIIIIFFLKFSKLQPELSNTNIDCLIKGNISSSGKIYHVLGGQFYDKTIVDISKGERWFCSEAEAQNAGWRRSLR